jgi:F0F1-type ATP synthase delta subunit
VWEWKERKAPEHQQDVVLASLNIAERIVNLTQELKKGLLDRSVKNGYKKLILNSIAEAIADLQALFTVVSEEQ